MAEIYMQNDGHDCCKRPSAKSPRKAGAGLSSREFWQGKSDLAYATHIHAKF